MHFNKFLIDNNMKNYFNFKIGDYVMHDGRGCRLDEELFEEFFSANKRTSPILPIPFSFKVLSGLPGFWYSTLDRKSYRRRFYIWEIYFDNETHSHYANSADGRVYFTFFHEFQAYLRKYFDYEIIDDNLFYDFIDHINDLCLFLDFIIKNGKPCLVKSVNDKKGNRVDSYP